MAPKKHSGFMMFVNEWRQNNSQGRNMTLAQAVTHCGDMWKNLTMQQRGPYNSSAKDADVQARATKERLNCCGQAISDVDKAQREMTDSVLQMKRTIERMVMDAKKSHDLENTKFVFCAFNYFTKALKSDVYMPAEFAACEYSLKEGIMSVYSTLIDPGHIIFGQASDAQQHASTTHGLPLPPKALGEKNMEKLYSQIVAYLTKCHGNKPLIVFTPTENMAVVKSCMRFLACESDKDALDGLNKIIVYDIQYLFLVLKKEVLSIAGLPDDKINIYVTDTIFLRDFFEFTPEIACQFHEVNDRAKYCTQSMVKRWCFIFSDYMCGDLAITVKPGKHIPPKTRPNYKVIPADGSSLSRESSFDSFYSLPGSRSTQGDKNRNASPTGSQRSTASAYVPTDHTVFASGLNEGTEFPSLGDRRPKGRRAPAGGAGQRELGAWNLPAPSRTLNEFSDDDFSVVGAGNRNRH
ncbi:protein maelstrom [Drosophila kikkawai]|uniref:Protein maelstrom n=1 Tax=Drosophila kikkawai TaxID=30033 RepID=A0A6P4HVA4_DROKI|nr:protein maelstrom [Drosophila kikkawai]XP_017019605.1 protein maelstrom [Drosophila kikkawai]